ncbi:MAG: ABC transporter permease [Acidobacteria bacterium]|nr:ABC transporter permease [Acidobacteriota bacterium]
MDWVEGTRGRGRRWFGGLSLDLKLGGRMLVKYPGLTIVGGLAMAFAICVGTVVFEVLTLFVAPSLPLPAGDRIVQVRNWDISANGPEPRALYDFTIWRSSLRSVTELGAWRDVTTNLIVTEGDARPVQVAEMTPNGFGIAAGTPLMGRVLAPSDQVAGAAPVAVIGYDLWRARFGSDPNVLGRSVQLGSEFASVVGVMREGFAFPVSHEVWTPLRTDIAGQAPRSGLAVSVFGVLAPGATLETAQAELAAFGRRLAGEQRATHEHLQPRVAPYAEGLFASSGEEIVMAASIYSFVIMLLVLVCSNVALLLFARAATRETELVVRTALGASRSRIVTQMFAEALVLGGCAAVVGLAAAQFILSNWGVSFLEVNLGRLPFWYDLSLSPATVLFAIGLTVLGSGIAGVMPALKVTRGMGSRLKQASAGAGGLQFGGIWTAVIVVQVAVTVAFPALVYVEQWQLRRVETFEAGFAAEEYLAVRLEKDASSAAAQTDDAARTARRAAFAATVDELRRRVSSEPGVTGVTFVDRLPRTERPEYEIELSYDSTTPRSGGGSARLPFREATVAGIEPSYFDVLQTPILAGRAFNAGDLTSGGKVAIVDQGFIDQVLEGRNPIGQQVRFVGRSDPKDPAPWFEIVGVVKDLGMGTPTRRSRAAGFYVPATPERFDRVYMMVHVGGDPMLLAPQLREVSSAVDPTLRLSEFQRVNEVTNDVLWVVGLWLRVTVLMTAVALLLSLAGIYAVLSFTVARRTREIGLRVALGANPRRVIGAILRRPLWQVGCGVLGGVALIAAVGSMELEMPGMNGELSLKQFAIIMAYGILMLGVCLLACVVPTRRALRVEPTVALRVD